MVSARKFHFVNLPCRLVLPMILVYLCTFLNPIYAQYNLLRDEFYGGDNFDELLSVIEVDDGLVYGGSTGAFINTMGDAPQTNGNSDYWIYKTDYDGNIIWSYVYGGSGQETLTSLIRTQDGGFIAVGFSFSNISGDKTEDSRGSRDVWVVKLDQNGLFDWDATYGGDDDEVPFKIIQAQDGSYYFGGFTESSLSGEVSFPSRGGVNDIWIGHIDINGGLIYDRRFGGASDDLLFDIKQLENGDLLIGSLSASNIGGEKSEDSFGGQDAWIIRMTPAGSIVWDRTYGGTFGDRAVSVLELANNQILIGGDSSSGMTGNKTSGNNGASDYWLIKLEANGDFVWDRTYGGAGQDELNELKVNDKGIIFLGGWSNSDSSGDKTEDGRGNTDEWLIVVDESDDVLYDITLGGSDADQLHDFIFLREGGIIIGGFTLSDTSGDITDVSNGLQDALVFYLDCTLDDFLDLGLDATVCPNTELTLNATINQPNLCSYLWEDGVSDPIRDIIIASDMEFGVTVTDIFQCPAIDTIEFTILDGPEVDLGPTISICEDGMTILDATDPNCPTCTYLWDDMSTDPQLVVSPAFNTNYQVTVTNDINCSTTDGITVNVFANSLIRVNDVTCNPAEARNDTIFSLNQSGCDSLTVFNIILLPSDTLRFTQGVCDVDSVGRDTVYETNALGCDSLNIFTYFQLPSSQIDLSSGTCDPDQVGLDSVFLSNEFNCDSLIITEFFLLPSSENTENFTTCDPAAVGRDTLIFSNEFGCDSIIINVTDLLLSDTIRFNESVCVSDEERLDTMIFQNDVGCDSLVITNYFFVASDTIVVSEFTCDPDEVRNDSLQIINPSGCDTLFVEIVNLAPRSEDDELILTCDINQVPRDTFFGTNIFGCDSIIYIEYQLLRSDTTRLQDYICDAAAFSDTMVLQNIFGCDSLIITDFDPAESDDVFFDDSTCDASLEGTQVYELTNQFGCDSTVTINFTLVEEQVTILQENTCNPAQFIPDTLIFPTAFCDSIVIIQYSVQEEDNTTVNLTSCDESDVGEFETVFTNQQGCDSTVTQIVSFSEVDSNFVQLFECTRLDTLVELFSFTNQFGCDSIVVQTTYPGLDTTFVESNVCEVNEEFRTEEVFSSVQGCDSVVVSIGLVSESLETTFEIYTCDQDQVGTNSINYISAEGCDSVVVFNTLLGEIDILTNIRDVPCGEFNTGQVSISGIYGRLPYLYSFDGSTFGTQNTFSDLSAGTYTLGVQDADGCEAFTEIEIREVSGVEILLPDFVQVDFGDPISLSPVISGEFTEFYWTGIDSLFCETCLVQNYTPLTSTVLTFNVLSVDGCLEKHLVNIAVSKNYEVFIPNAFSPNGDNTNDFFTIFADDDVELIQSFRIYSRWGEKVFEGRDFSPNDEQQGWNGQTNGKQMNPGVFIYSATVRFVDGEIRSFEGDFSLIR